jgi:hypothetical protein
MDGINGRTAAPFSTERRCSAIQGDRLRIFPPYKGEVPGGPLGSVARRAFCIAGANECHAGASGRERVDSGDNRDDELRSQKRGIGSDGVDRVHARNFQKLS